MAIDANPPHKAKLSSERVLLQMLLQIDLLAVTKNRNSTKDIVQSVVPIFLEHPVSLPLHYNMPIVELRIETAIIFEHTTA